MDTLQRHVKAWNDLDVQVISIPAPSESDIYEFANGIFVIGVGHSLTCIELPSHLRGLSESRIWVHADVGHEPDGLVFVPAQDLLVLMGGYVLCTLNAEDSA